MCERDAPMRVNRDTAMWEYFQSNSIIFIISYGYFQDYHFPPKLTSSKGSNTSKTIIKSLPLVKPQIHSYPFQTQVPFSVQQVYHHSPPTWDLPISENLPAVFLQTCAQIYKRGLVRTKGLVVRQRTEISQHPLTIIPPTIVNKSICRRSFRSRLVLMGR
jgi:hypothetical protein